MRVIVVDDEPLGRRGVRARLTAARDMAIVAECATGRDAISAIQRLSPDLVFLDIRMPDMNGFDVLRQLPARCMPLVIFVTAHDDYALQAFDAHAIDYLLKPIDDARFVATLDRARLLGSSHRVQDVGHRVRDLIAQLHRHPSRGPYRNRLIARSRTRVSIVPVSQIDWIGATGDYITLHVGSKQHLVRQTISALEQELDPDLFLRIHRSTIVQTSRMIELVTLQNGEFLVRLTNGTELRTSRTYSRKLEEWL
jgi:two-component system LytT family response regulator